MLERRTFGSISAIILVIALGGCSKPADPGFLDTPTKNSEDAGTADSGSAAGSQGSQGSAGTVASNGGAPGQPTAPGGTSASSSGGSSSGGTSSSGGSAGSTSIKPNYDQSVTLDDGILRIWTLGDSITVGVNGGFRNDVYNMATADGYKVDMVGTLYDDSAEIADKDHEGHTAFTFLNALENVDTWIASIDEPDVVLMMLGSNDFAWWTNRDPASHLDDMNQLLDHVLPELPRSAFIIATLPPQSSEVIESIHLDRTDMVEEFDSLLKSSLPKRAEYGKQVFLADVRAVLDLSELYDGIHPTRQAHKQVAQAWYEVMKQILPPP